MVWNSKLLICLLICFALQIHLTTSKPLPDRGPGLWQGRRPGRFRNHNWWPWKHYGNWENEYDDAPAAVTTNTPVAVKTPAAVNTPQPEPAVSCAPDVVHAPTTSTPASSTIVIPPLAVEAAPAAPTTSTATGPVPGQQFEVQPSDLRPSSRTSAPIFSGTAVDVHSLPPVLLPSPLPSAAAPSANVPVSVPSPAATPATPAAGGQNIFVAVASGLPPAQIAPKDGHPEQGVGLSQGHVKPVQTNKFYTNWLLGDQTQSVFTYPYSLRWVRGAAPTMSWGLAVSHVDRTQTVYGAGNPASYFVNPIGLDSIILTAAELLGQTVLSTADHEGFSITARLAESPVSQPIISFPVVQGMGMVTAVYSSGSVAIYSSLSFGAISEPVQVGSSTRYTVTLLDGKTWAIYLTPTAGGAAPTLAKDPTGTLLRGPNKWSGLVQVAKLLSIGETALYDKQAGAYAVGGVITGTTSGSYSIAWQKKGDASKTLVMFALPHHVDSFAADTKAQAASVVLTALTKGTGTAIVADTWNLIEQLPTTMGFAPWSPTHQSVTSLPASALSVIQSTLATEIGEDFLIQTNLNTVYFSGKGLAKVASLVYLASDLVKSDSLAKSGLQKLKDSFAVWVSNKAASTLVYDTTWKGVVSSAGFSDPGADYGATYYNDHMFHYGYFVYAASVIATLDPSWLTQGSNKAWVNSLVRDYANSVTDDAYFPFSRCFDWYHGHSWASGLFAAGDGKNLESSSEDTFASFAIKMWGKATGDVNMEARGNLMLAIEARSLDKYFLMQSDNKVQPPNFIGNKATGILFDNKIDHTTYFGTNIEYIQGIHMIPIGAHSGLTRKAAFVQQEWSTYFDAGRADAVDGSWRALLYGNLALVNPTASWAFFSQSSFNSAWLENGASRSWYLAIAAALGGVN